MLVAPAWALHRLYTCQSRLAAAKRKGLWLDAPGGPTLAEAPLEYGPSLVDLGALSPADAPRFYLPDASFELLSDCYAIVEGMRLPLHAQVLAARAAVLRQLFVAQSEGGAGAGTHAVSFASCAWGARLPAAVHLAA